MARRKKKVKKMDQVSILKSVRKPLPPKGQVFKSGDEYNRKDKAWLDDVDI